MIHNHSQKSKKIISLKKAKSLIEKIETMVAQDQYCIDIMQQNLAVIGLLKNLNKTLMEDHLGHCFKDAILSKDSARQQKMTQEIIAVTSLNK